MKPKIQTLVGIPITVVHAASPLVWELKPEKMTSESDEHHESFTTRFVAHEREVQWVKWSNDMEPLPGPPTAPRLFDGVQLREEFMELRNELQFLAFLNKYGSFSSLDQAEKSRGWTLQELMSSQTVFAELATRAPETWKEYANSTVAGMSFHSRALLNDIGRSGKHAVTFHFGGIPQINWRGTKRLAVIDSKSVLSTILATIEVDVLRGVEFGVCGRHDCPMFFEITSQHIRKYCSQYCAHLVSVRRTRAKKKETTSAPINGRATRPGQR